MTDRVASGAAPGVPPALEVTGLFAGYGTTTVLRDVSITVPPGSIVALLGPNGAGKTTLLRSVAGFVDATRGTVRMHGKEITRDRPHRRSAAGLCLVPEGRGIFRNLTVRENLAMQAHCGQEVTALEQATTAFPILGERLGQQAGTLSGGQQQMLAVAAAYVRDPSLVLVDEASLGLAPIVVDEIFAFLERLSGRGTSLLVVDQFVTRALDLASHAYVLQHGAVSYDGPAAALLDDDLFARYLG